MEEYITIKENVTEEITEKKSKFIANLIKINTKEEAEQTIKQIKKKYHDARHNCIAYRIIENGNLIEKSSDDGEPSGTAGAPMLNLLQKNNLCNILIIVTRYFRRNTIRNRRPSKSIFRSNKKSNRKSRKNTKNIRNRNASNNRIRRIRKI